MRLASYQVTIAAPVKVVWAHLTTAEGLVRWVGSEATAEPAPGGVLCWTHPDGATTLRLVHHGLPPETVQAHQQGWAYFLGALRDTLSAGR